MRWLPFLIFHSPPFFRSILNVLLSAVSFTGRHSRRLGLIIFGCGGGLFSMTFPIKSLSPPPSSVSSVMNGIGSQTPTTSTAVLRFPTSQDSQVYYLTRWRGCDPSNRMKRKMGINNDFFFFSDSLSEKKRRWRKPSNVFSRCSVPYILIRGISKWDIEKRGNNNQRSDQPSSCALHFTFSAIYNKDDGGAQRGVCGVRKGKREWDMPWRLLLTILWPLLLLTCNRFPNRQPFPLWPLWEKAWQWIKCRRTRVLTMYL